MFTGDEARAITLEEARGLVRRWREGRSALPGDPSCEFFGRDIIDKILAQEGCVGLRIYHGRNAKGQHALVLLGSDADGNNLADVIAEEGWPCPPVCPVSGGLD
ncbi:MAG TPA: hypothetical protein VFS74_11060 [Gemmatimonadales bacterium]|jgi:hypothetical protein|nr:hypothetical protein [Gemmatimonadales bacterium]